MERYLRPLPLLGLAFLLRATMALWTSTLAADGAFHLMTAQGLLDGRFGELLGTYFMHPLNPILTAALAFLPGGVETGGAAVGVILSSLALLPLHAMTLRFWNARIAGWTGLLYALHPVLLDEGSEVLNTGAYLFFFLSAFALGVFALDTRRRALFALCGAACGLLYLTRPEGLLVPAFLAAMAAGRLKTDGRRLLLDGLLAAGIFLLVASPYLFWLRSHTGRWTLTARRSAQRLLASPSAASTKEPRVNPAYKIFRTALKAEYPVLVPFLLLGLALQGRMGGSRRNLAWAAALGAATLAPSIFLLIRSGFLSPSHRYFLPAVCLLLPWTAAGLLLLKDVAGRPGWIIVGALLAVLLVKDVGPRRAEERTLREAGTWIRTLNLPPAVPLLSRSEKIPWYAGLRHGGIAFTGDRAQGVQNVLDARRRGGSTHFVLDSATLSRYLPADAEESFLAAGFEPISSFEKPGCDLIRVYRWSGPP